MLCLRVAAAVFSIAALNVGWSNSPGTPSDTDRSKWPTHRQSTPSIAAIASAFSTPSAVSIWQKSVVRRLAATNLSATAPGR